jgi:hypothetical protein
MNIRFTPFQSVFNYCKAYQFVLKPIILIVAGAALAAVAAAFLLRFSRSRPRRFSPTPPQIYSRTIEGTYQVSPVRSELKSNPSGYLTDLAKAIESRGIQMPIHVRFQNRNEDGHLVFEEASDLGGPSRQYFYELFRSLKELYVEKKTPSQEFALHQSKNETLLIPQGNPIADPRSSTFHAIGLIMMYVYFHEESFLIGSLFHEAFFSAILSLSDREIDTPFAELSDAAKFKMCKTLIQTQQALGEDFDSYQPILALLEKGEGFTEKDLNDIGLKNFYAGAALEEDSREFLGLEGDECSLCDVRLNTEKILKNKKAFLSSCLRYVLQQKTGSLGTIELTLFPIHTMARAMKQASQSRWSEIRNLARSNQSSGLPTAISQLEGAKRLQRKIQGVLDPAEMVRKIRVPDGESQAVVQQAEWLKLWILKATDNEIEGLVIFWTGSSAIDWEKMGTLDIQGRGDVMLPRSSTCFSRLYVREEFSEHDHAEHRNNTEEAFHKMLDTISKPECWGTFTDQ